jgi:hypothetical protein
MARRQGIPSSKTSLKQQLGRVKIAKRQSFQSYGGYTEDQVRTRSMYEEPALKADKGKKAGSCNRRACQKPGAVFYNRGSYAYYCGDCARLINDAYLGDLGDEPLCSIDESAVELLMDKC